MDKYYLVYLTQLGVCVYESGVFVGCFVLYLWSGWRPIWYDSIEFGLRSNVHSKPIVLCVCKAMCVYNIPNPAVAYDDGLL